MAHIPALMTRQKTISFEFFPPKTLDGAIKLTQTLNHLQTLHPSFFSVTYGAAGSERHRTADVVVALQHERNVPTMAHLTCLGHTKDEVAVLCDQYASNGIENILALGGDAPADGSRVPFGDFLHASELVEFLREDGRFSIGVAAHPEGHPRSTSLLDDRWHLARKLELADFAVTQFFFEADVYLRMVDDLRSVGCDKPVLPGVIPITDAAQVERFAALAGASIPLWLRQRIEAADVADVATLGIDVARELSQELLDKGAPGIHLYTMNNSAPAAAVAGQLFAPTF